MRIIGFFWLGIIVFVAVSAGFWLEHIVYRLSTHEWGILIAGAICAPIGSIDGMGLLFHWWK